MFAQRWTMKFFVHLCNKAVNTMSPSPTTPAAIPVVAIKIIGSFQAVKKVHVYSQVLLIIFQIKIKQNKETHGSHFSPEQQKNITLIKGIYNEIFKQLCICTDRVKKDHEYCFKRFSKFSRLLCLANFARCLKNKLKIFSIYSYVEIQPLIMTKPNSRRL